VRRPAAFSPVWWQERGLTAMLAFLVLALFIGAPLSHVLGQLPFDIFFSLLLVSGVVAFSRRRWLAGAVALSGVFGLALRWARFESGREVANAGETWLSLLTMLILTGLVLEHVFREGSITGDRIRGAIAAYLLLGLVWTFAYILVEHFSPGAIQSSGAASKDNAHFAYFSFVTLTTLGYGDIVPVHPLARTLAIGEALVGQLYLAILIGRLISLQIAARDQR
jgi:hypothetical protein